MNFKITFKAADDEMSQIDGETYKSIIKTNNSTLIMLLKLYKRYHFAFWTLKENVSTICDLLKNNNNNNKNEAFIWLNHVE